MPTNKENSRAKLSEQTTAQCEKAEDTLKETREQTEFERKRLETILETTPSAVVIIDAPSGKFSYVNKRAMQLYGFDTLGLGLDENVAKVKARRADGTDYPIEEMPVSRSLKLGQAVRNEEMLIERPDGQVLPIIASTAPLRDMQGNITAAIIVFEDITERKKAEQTLLSKERELASIYASVPEILFFLSVNPENSFRFLSVSKSFLDVTGLQENQVVGKRVQEVIPEPSLSLVLEKYAQAIREHKTIWWQEVTDYPSGRKHGEVSVTPFCDSSGRCTNLIGSVYDITERKKAEEALKASEEKANHLIKYAPSGIYELDYRIPPKFRSVNDAMCQILGYTREELLATSPFALLDDESKIRFRERIMKMLAGEKVDETVEFKVIPRDGREIYAVLNTTFTYKDGKPDGALVIAHDVTERKKAERELEKRAKNLESLVEERTKALRGSERLAAIGATAGMVGHDIRNPLQAITSDVYLLKDYLATMPEVPMKNYVAESLDGIEKNVDYINKIVQDLQDYARPITPSAIELDLAKLFEEVTLKKAIPEKIEAFYHIEKGAEKIVNDSSLLKRILANLVNNAVQAMPNGGKLTIRACKVANDVVIAVEDTGVGISEQVKPKLFTPMVTTKAKGQGFGLAVVKRLTEALGGTVSFDSREGKGTTFIIRLPLKSKKIN